MSKTADRSSSNRKTAQRPSKAIKVPFQYYEGVNRQKVVDLVEVARKYISI